MATVFDIEPTRLQRLRLLYALEHHGSPVLHARSDSVILQLFKLTEARREPSTAEKTVVSEQLKELEQASLVEIRNFDNGIAESARTTPAGSGLLERLLRLSKENFSDFVSAVNAL
jgi:DNA-binding transcriptional ArsR family regulator